MLSFQRVLQNCLYCSKMGVPMGLCAPCFSRIKEQLVFYRSWQNLPFFTYSLFLWQASNHELFQPLVYSLKEGRWGAMSQELSMLLRQCRGEGVRGPFVFVPAPPKKEGVLDHSGLLAQQLSEGESYWDGLRRASSEEAQKRKGRKGRLKTQVFFKNQACKEEIKRHLSQGKKVIFVDDVQSTGGTALAVYKCLGEPKGFECWTVFKREAFLH